jgi:hypothetical protein
MERRFASATPFRFSAPIPSEESCGVAWETPDPARTRHESRFLPQPLGRERVARRCRALATCRKTRHASSFEPTLASLAWTGKGRAAVLWGGLKGATVSGDPGPTSTAGSAATEERSRGRGTRDGRGFRVGGGSCASAVGCASKVVRSLRQSNSTTPVRIGLAIRTKAAKTNGVAISEQPPDH